MMINDWLDENSDYGFLILRVGLSLVFLYFGLSQLTDPARFTGWLPPETSVIPLAPAVLIIINGAMEVVFGTLLFLGVYTRLSAFLLGIHLFAISFSIGFSETGVRDFGLAMAATSMVLMKPDRFTIDSGIHSPSQ